MISSYSNYRKIQLTILKRIYVDIMLIKKIIYSVKLSILNDSFRNNDPQPVKTFYTLKCYILNNSSVIILSLMKPIVINLAIIIFIFPFQSFMLMSENKTEKQIMQELGYDRIWDCGHFRYEMTF